MSTRSHRLLALGLLIAAGCGVGDYEARMLQSQKRYQYWEEASRHLGDAVSVPERTDKERGAVPIFTVYFRPPKGIGSVPSKEPRGLLYTYTPAVLGGAGPFAFVEVAATEVSDKTFEQTILSQLSARPTPSVSRGRLLRLGEPSR